MDNINRMAIMVFPKEPLVDWANNVDPDNVTWADDLLGRGNVYLIPEFENFEEAEEYVQEIFEEIFENELSDWFEDEKVWPEPRTYELFLEWFDVMYDVMAFDTLSSPIEKAE
ncbi:MAG: hypothetical protein HQL19_06840 [Candidatus Omnitrophica bacterium]|nr:hypothetical protein [Candidatus Omnitrophota bacterium]